MKTMMLAGAAALALAVSPAIGQNQTTEHQHAAMTDAQMGMYDSWPAERRAEHDRWPADYRTYFWTLTPDQQRGWWALTDDQRKRVYDMTPEQRVAAWNSINAQLAGATPSANASTTAQTATTAATMASTAGPRWVSNAVVQNVSADAPPPNPPICNKGQTDNCINAWEAGKRGANVTRPLDHWPGKPASEM